MIKEISREQYDLSAEIAALRDKVRDALQLRNSGTCAQKLALKRTVKALDDAYRIILEC